MIDVMRMSRTLSVLSADQMASGFVYRFGSITSWLEAAAAAGAGAGTGAVGSVVAVGALSVDAGAAASASSPVGSSTCTALGVSCSCAYWRTSSCADWDMVPSASRVGGESPAVTVSGALSVELAAPM